MKKAYLFIIGMILLLGVFQVSAQKYTKENETWVTSGDFRVSGDKAGITIKPIITNPCSESWACSCVNGITQCTDSNNCGTTNTIPASQGQTCSNNNNNNNGGGSGSGGGSSTSSGGGSGRVTIDECIELWQCKPWTTCKDGEQTRECADVAKCNSTYLKPATERECTEDLQLKVTEEEDSNSPILGAVMGALGNLGKSRSAVVIIFIALILAASLIISAMRSGAPIAPAPVTEVVNPEIATSAGAASEASGDKK